MLRGFNECLDCGNQLSSEGCHICRGESAMQDEETIRANLHKHPRTHPQDDDDVVTQRGPEG